MLSGSVKQGGITWDKNMRKYEKITWDNLDFIKQGEISRK